MSTELDLSRPPAELEAFYGLRDWASIPEDQRREVCEVAEISRARGRVEVFGGEGVVALRTLEHEAIRHALKVSGGSIGKAAKLLGVSRATMYRRVAEGAPEARLDSESVCADARAQGGTP